MIVYSLHCAKDHEFEAWFRDSAAYEMQRAKRAVTCPECGSTKIKKAPMAPRLSKGSKLPAAEVPASSQSPAEVAKPPSKSAALMARSALEAIRKEIEAKCDYVGEQFAEEARKIHYGETKKRDIYGETSDAEAEALSQEGIEFQRIPWIRRTDG
ncbi:MAG TPA: DUF1178 family protein [Alphaproteobacteria bacterium]|nr:DUF1178 family protein [Alphaproteobacteria bacterium]